MLNEFEDNYEIIERQVEMINRLGLSKYEVSPYDKYKMGQASRISSKNGHDLTFQYFASKCHIEGVKLVFGLYYPFLSENSYPHYWVELPNEVIFDGFLNCFYQKEGYYNYYQCYKILAYDQKEMYKLGMRPDGSFEPWDDEEAALD